MLVETSLWGEGVGGGACTGWESLRKLLKRIHSWTAGWATTTLQLEQSGTLPPPNSYRKYSRQVWVCFPMIKWKAQYTLQWNLWTTATIEDNPFGHHWGQPLRPLLRCWPLYGDKNIWKVSILCLERAFCRELIALQRPFVQRFHCNTHAATQYSTHKLKGQSVRLS